MRWTWMKWVYRIRIWIYLTGIFAVIAITITKCSRETEKKETAQLISPEGALHNLAASYLLEYISDSKEIPSADDDWNSDSFWPPDMIPHPVPPWEHPTDPKEPEIA